MTVDSSDITVKEAAIILGYSDNNVYRLLWEGVLPGRKFGNTWIIKRSDVEELKKRQTDKGRLPKGEATR